MLEVAVKCPGRPVGSRKSAPPALIEKMIDALMIWSIDLDEPGQVCAALRRSGFGSGDRHDD